MKNIVRIASRSTWLSVVFVGLHGARKDRTQIAKLTWQKQSMTTTNRGDNDHWMHEQHMHSPHMHLPETIRHAAKLGWKFTSYQ
jgi:hypothetical protein